MHLDEYISFDEIDKKNMYDEIIGLPDQLLNAWELGARLPYKKSGSIHNIVIAGMGGSAIGADILAAYLFSQISIPIFILRGYDLPAWARNRNTLVIASSHSGNTEETINVFKQGLQSNCMMHVVCTGGELEQLATSNDISLWKFKHTGQPRSAIGYSFALLLALLYRAGIVHDVSDEIAQAINTMRHVQEGLIRENMIEKNHAKQLANRLYGKYVSILGSGILAPVARRWKGQISEVSKAWAQFEEMPESDHNTLAGINNPKSLLSNLAIIFLSSSSDHERNDKRIFLTKRIMENAGLDTEIIKADGNNPLAHIWSLITLADFVSYYLAMLYEVDPTSIPTIQELKELMKGIKTSRYPIQFQKRQLL